MRRFSDICSEELLSFRWCRCDIFSLLFLVSCGCFVRHPSPPPCSPRFPHAASSQWFAGQRLFFSGPRLESKVEALAETKRIGINDDTLLIFHSIQVYNKKFGTSGICHGKNKTRKRSGGSLQSIDATVGTSRVRRSTVEPRAICCDCALVSVQ